MRYLKISCFVLCFMFFAVSAIFAQFPHKMSIIDADMLDVETANLGFISLPLGEAEKTNISDFVQGFLDAIKNKNWDKVKKSFYPAMIDKEERYDHVTKKIKSDKLLTRVKILKDKIKVFESECVFDDLDRSVKTHKRDGINYYNLVYVPLDMRDDYSVKLRYKGKYCKGKSSRIEEKNVTRPMFVLELEELTNGSYWIYNLGYVQEKAEYWQKKNVIPEVVIPYYKGKYFKEYNHSGRS